MGLSQKQLFWIINVAIFMGPLITIAVFFGSRQDPSMRVAAQTAAITMGGQLITIVSTLLIGSHKDPDASQPQQVTNAPSPPTIPSA